MPGLFAGDERVDVFWARPPRRDLPGLARSLRRERFDLVLDFQSLPITAMLTAATGGFGIGFRKRGRSPWYRRTVDLARHRGTDYTPDHKLDLLRALGLSPSLSSPRLPQPEAIHADWDALPAGPRVAVVPVSLVAEKRWDLDAIAEAVRSVHAETGAVFCLAGGPGEEPPLRALSARLEEVPHRVSSMKSLPEFASLFAGADLYLGNDGGPRHIAIALGVPSVAWFGPPNPANWTPPGDPRHVVLWSEERAKDFPPARRDLRIIPEDRNDLAARACVDLLSVAEAGSRTR
jgi:ADP-heptose:LPS heptosyltransferase